MLRFTRDHEDAGYQARTETHRYVVTSDGRGWRLTVQQLTTTAGVRHACGQPIVAESWDDTRGLCYAVANAYHDLGDDYQEHEHGHRARLTEAINRAYAVTP